MRSECGGGEEVRSECGEGEEGVRSVEKVKG